MGRAKVGIGGPVTKLWKTQPKTRSQENPRGRAGEPNPDGDFFQFRVVQIGRERREYGTPPNTHPKSSVAVLPEEEGRRAASTIAQGIWGAME